MLETLNNVDIDLQSRTITYDDNSVTSMYLEITDGDLTLLEYGDIDSFLYLFAEYCYFRIKYINGGDFPGNNQLYNGWDTMDPIVITWAENLCRAVYPSIGGSAQRVKLYPKGGFKIILKTYE